MKTTTIPASLFAFIAAVAAYPVGPNVVPRGCEPGALVCNGSNKFAICNIDASAFWMTVSEGTECVCSGSSCTIASVSGASGLPVVSTPVASTNSEPAPPKTTIAPAPTTTQAQTEAPTSTPKPFQNNPELGHAPTSESAPPATSAPAAVVSSSASLPPVVVPTSTSSAAAPKKTSSPGGGGSAGKGYLRTFLGNGDPSQGWPEESEWASFENMWSSNLANTIYKSCAAFDQTNNSDQESADLKDAIQSVAKSSGVDERFILAVVMQESGGCVRAPTTNYGVMNPGLMQSHNGENSCFNVSPCPKSKIQGMIKDGVSGTSSGDGLVQLLAKAGSGVSQYYKASRMYNSGSIAASGLLQDGIATKCYASDIANRLIGWSKGVGTCKIG